MGAASGRRGVWEVDQAPGLLTHMDQRNCPATHTLCDGVRLRGSGVGVGRSSPTTSNPVPLFFSFLRSDLLLVTHQ